MAEAFTIDDFDIRYTTVNPERIVYLILPEGLKEDVLSWLQNASVRHDCSIVLISGCDWNNDMTPWEAEGVFRKAKPFGGNAEGFLRILEERLIPEVERVLGTMEPKRALSGVSLSGLFTVRAAYYSNIFETFASISGSLWFDGFADWCEERKLADESSKVILLLGDREKNSKNPRMAAVQDCTERIHRSLPGSEYILEENVTHFSPIIPRLELMLELIFPQIEKRAD